MEIPDERIDLAAAVPQTTNRVADLFRCGRPGGQAPTEVDELVDAALEVDRIETAALDEPLDHVRLGLDGPPAAVMPFFAQQHDAPGADIGDQFVELA